MISWVVFDLGDVVLRSTSALSALSELLPADRGSFAEAYYRHRGHYDLHSDPAAFWTAVAAGAGSAEPDAELIAELVRVDDLGWSEADPDTLALIADLDASGSSLAVLSNAPSSMGRLVSAEPWAAVFRRLFFSGDLGLAKPDQRIYRHLVAELGAVPAEVVFLDDRADNIAGANEAGIRGLLFTGAAQARSDLRALGLGV